MAGVFHEETSAGFIGRRRTSLAARTLSLSVRCSLRRRVNNNNNAADAVRSYGYEDVLRSVLSREQSGEHARVKALSAAVGGKTGLRSGCLRFIKIHQK